MAIESHFYDTVPGEGINEIEWAESARSRGPVYGVVNPAELLCTAHPSTPYAVNISPAPSGFWGHGVWDTSDSVVTVVFTPPAQGARRFDLVAGHRDWTPTGGGPTTIQGIQGSSTRALPASRQTRPGEVDDQPLWLVEWLGGQTQPQSITDLRCFGSNNGLMAMDKLALVYLKGAGTSVRIGAADYTYKAIGNGLWDWVSCGFRSIVYDLSFAKTSGTNSFTIAECEIADPGFPYIVQGHATVEAATNADSRWDVRMTWESRGWLDVSRGDVVRPWWKLAGVGRQVVTGPTVVALYAHKAAGSGSFVVASTNRIFRVVVSPA